MEKYGDGDLSTPVMGLKPVASRQPTPFPPPACVPRCAIRSIVTAPHAREIAPPLLLIENPNPEHGPLIEPHSIAVVEAPPPRVLEATLPISTAVAGPIDGGDTTQSNDVAVKPETAQAAVQHPAILREGGIAFSRPPMNVAPADFIPAPTPTPTPHIYIGNVPLTPNSHCFDKIAEAFHNSSRKTLSFVPLTLQNGKIVVRPSLDVIRDGARRWSTTAVGYFLGKRPYFHHVNEFVRSAWPLVREVKATSNGFYFFEFKTIAAMEEVIEGGPWLFRGQPIVL
ncbi:UNVERIFIED_CONTAM: hypothetical protein Slati_4244000 [Sesamum latifolium]|uniref:DUF4283 domain-containing protein n=1 Tax=Sesamum latifolium TaxID=2727402 RepID=A0AAW2TB55_9LAMI